MEIKRLDAAPGSARLVIHNHVAYFTGHVSREPFPTLREQTQALVKRYDELFAQFGLKRENILMYNGYFADLDKLPEFFEVFNPWVGTHGPAGVTVGVSGIGDGRLVELALIVAVDGEG